jgi:DNA-binding response OmpR family regulator
MVVHEPRVHPASPPRAVAPTWLVLARSGPAADLAASTAGARVIVVDDLLRFSDLLRDERPAIVVLSEPPAGPLETEMLAAERRRRPGLRIVHLTPDQGVARRLAALRLGFDEALPASVGGFELAERLHLLGAASGPARGAGALLAVGPGLVLDVEGRELRRDGVAVPLNPKVYDLLALLASHPGYAYTRDEILANVWGSPVSSVSRTVDVHVRWLRMAIEADPDRPRLVLTVRHHGYRYAPDPTRP